MLCSLVFSVIISCSGYKKETRAITIQWKDNRAEAIVIPPELLKGINYDSIDHLVRVQLVNVNTSILGKFNRKKDSVVFHPLLAFTHGLKYEIRIGEKSVQQFEIPTPFLEAPRVISVFPTGDTLPQNLLKFYVQFSKPMQPGEPWKKIFMIKNERDTVPVFLDLELWSSDQTLLTLWLDPGRIKRDLQPNLKMGPPLEQGIRYRLLIKNGWRDAEGVLMKEAYHKGFIVGSRDSLSPDPRLWTIEAPKAGTDLPVKIYLHEPLDHTLLRYAISIIDNNSGRTMNGTFETESAETILNFIPSVKWNKGEYTIAVEARLEDLAGNNLDHLFDRDITQKDKTEPKNINQRSFRVQ